jgi:hypothetical protein
MRQPVVGKAELCRCCNACSAEEKRRMPIDKIVESFDEAVAEIPDGATILYLHLAASLLALCRGMTAVQPWDEGH